MFDFIHWKRQPDISISSPAFVCFFSLPVKMGFRIFPLTFAFNVFVEVKQFMSFCINRCSYVIEDENKQEEQAAGLYCDS